MKIIQTNIPGTKGTLAAVIHYSKTQTGRLAILCAGYLDSKDYNHLVKLADALCERGYTVVRFDATGIWESEGGIYEYTTTQYLVDIKSVLEYMLDQGDYQKILLGGHSRGATAALLYAARDSRISEVLAIMPSAPGLMAEQRRNEWEKTGCQISWRDVPGSTEKREFCVPFSFVNDRDHYDVLKEVKKISAPIFLLAGELDTVVLADDVRRIFEEANEPKKFVVLSGIGHDYRHSTEQIKIVNNFILEQL